MSIEETVINCINDCLEEKLVISLSDTLINDLNFDSLDGVNLDLWLREEFNNPLIETKIHLDTTVQDVIDQVKKFLPH